ncbi:hypothetical protein EP7_000864 [Isosphaeraceae bacterium EP7]
MEEPGIDETPQPRRFRRILRLIAGLAILFVLVLASMPTVLSTSPARRLLVQVVNKKFSPGRIELGAMSLSWTGSLTLDDVVLVDPSGKKVIKAKSIQTDRGILGLLASRPNYGTIRVDGASVDVERHADGSIDAIDALGGLMNAGGDSQGDPSLALSVVVKGGRVRIASPELAEPISAVAFDASATIVPGKPLDAVMTIAEAGRSLELRAGYELYPAKGTSADQTLLLTGKDWPIAVREAGITAKGNLVGTVGADRRKGLWSARGNATLRKVVADGPVLAGDRLTLESVEAGCDLMQTPTGWSIRMLDLKCPIGELTASGTVPASATTPTLLEGHVDLAAASKLLPLTLHLRDGIVIDRGQARIEARLTSQGGADRLAVSANIADLAATERGRPIVFHNPASLSAALVRTKGVLAVETFVLKAAGVDATVTGDLERGLKLSGTIDLAVVQAQLRDLIDLGTLDLAGKGRVAADYRRDGETFKARFAAELSGLKATGVAPQPIVHDHVRLEGTADGPRGENGLPTGWHAARLGIHAGETTANLHAKMAGEVTSIILDGSTSITSPTPARAGGKVSVRWFNRVYDIDELQLSAIPTDPKAVAGSISFAAKGRLDLTTGDLSLVPIGVQPAVGIGLAAEGLKLGGLGKSDAPMTLDAALVGELAALDQFLSAWMQSPPRGLGGGWSGRIAVARRTDGVLDFSGRMAAANLVMTTARGPVAVALKGTYATATDALDLASLDLATAFGRIVVGGKVAEATTKRIADISGTLEPRWETLDSFVASAVEPHAQVRATFKPFHIKGSLAGASASQVLKGLEGELSLDLTSAEAFGMKVGPTPIVLRLAAGKAAFDPISTTVNEGPAAIDADLYLDDPEGLWLRLAKGTKIDGAVINETVSNDVLSYIAPVLSKASKVTGKVSLTIEDAAIPMIGEGALRVDGQLVFQDVVFQPGPFGAEIFSLSGKVVPKMTLHQPLQLQIADGRVRQSGLSIPLSETAKANLEGSVGFDKTLSMKAMIPVTAQMMGGDATVKQIVGDTQITVPIGGTISRPTIDRAGFRLAVKDAARSMVKRGVKAQAGRLLDQVIPPAAAAGDATTNSSRGARGQDAFKLLEGVGRELLQPKPR